MAQQTISKTETVKTMAKQTNNNLKTTIMENLALYTEEQVRQIQQAILCNHKDAIVDENYCLNVTKPIELPSDEEIYLESRRYEKYHESMNELEAERSAARYHGHMQGAKWMRDKILNK